MFELTELDEQFRELQQLPKNWLDGLEGEVISLEVIDHARKVLLEILDRIPDLRKPQVFPTVVGGISLEWSDPMVDVIVCPNGEVDYVLQNGNLGDDTNSLDDLVREFELSGEP